MNVSGIDILHSQNAAGGFFFNSDRIERGAVKIKPIIEIQKKFSIRTQFDSAFENGGQFDLDYDRKRDRRKYKSCWGNCRLNG